MRVMCWCGQHWNRNPPYWIVTCKGLQENSCSSRSQLLQVSIQPVAASWVCCWIKCHGPSKNPGGTTESGGQTKKEEKQRFELRWKDIIRQWNKWKACSLVSPSSNESNVASQCRMTTDVYCINPRMNYYLWLIWMERGAELHSRKWWMCMNKPRNIVFQVSHQTVCQVVYSFPPFQRCCGEGETDRYKRWRVWRIASPDLKVNCCKFG